MEKEKNQIIIQQDQRLVSSHKQGQIAFVLTGVNDLLSYDMPPEKIASWAKHIDRMIPDLSIETLRNIIDNMLIGETPYDNKKGVQNIFIALRDAGAFGGPKMVY